MAGIVSYGSYVPYRRLKRSAIAAVLGTPAGKGERAIASFDEDSVSMAVEAARDALKSAPPGDVQALIFATTTPPYAEKLSAAVIGAAAQLPAEIRASDMTGSVRAGMSAILQGADAVSGGAKRALVAIGDCRLAAPEGKAEQTTGDGAVAFVLGADNVIAEIEASASLTREFLDTWRAQGERFAHSWEERFTLTQAHSPLLGTVIKNVLEKAKVAPTDLSKIILDAPNARAADEIAPRAEDRSREILRFIRADRRTDRRRACGPDALRGAARPRSPVTESSSRQSPTAPTRSCSASRPPTPRFKPVHSVGRMIESKGDVSYANYLKWREILPTEPPRRPDPDRPAGPPMMRSEKWKFGFIGSRCTNCGTPQLPPQLVCVKCHKRGFMEPYQFADRTAKIATYAIDRLAYSLNPPTVNVVADFDGGGRFLCEMTDCEPDKVAIGDEVEMTFRRLFTADGVNNYFWKARPRR